MNETRIATFALAALLVLLLVGVAVAGSSTNYDISWQVLSGGGEPATNDSGNITLNGSLGQTAIGPASSTSYGVDSGYWGKYYFCYLPIIVSPS